MEFKWTGDNPPTQTDFDTALRGLAESYANATGHTLEYVGLEWTRQPTPGSKPDRIKVTTVNSSFACARGVAS